MDHCDERSVRQARYRELREPLLEIGKWKPSLPTIWSQAWKPKEPIVYVPYRLAATLLVWGLARLRFTPNMVSMLSIATMALALAAAALLPGPRAGIPFVILAGFSFAFDCSDGTLARVTRGESALGHKVDLFSDRSCRWLGMSAVVVHEIVSVDGQGSGNLHLALGVAALYLLHQDIGGTLKGVRSFVFGQDRRHNSSEEPVSASGGHRRPLFVQLPHNVIESCIFYLAVGLGWASRSAPYVYATYVILLIVAIGRHLTQLAAMMKAGKSLRE